MGDLPGMVTGSWCKSAATKSFSHMLKGGGHKKFRGIVNTGRQELEVLAVLMGGGGGAQKVSIAHFKLEGGRKKFFGPGIFPFCSLPVINDHAVP